MERVAERTVKIIVNITIDIKNDEIIVYKIQNKRIFRIIHRVQNGERFFHQ